MRSTVLLLVVNLMAVSGLLSGLTARAQEPRLGDASQQQWHRLVPRTAADLRQLFRYSGEPLPLVSAHRGGAGPGLPENCIATFERTLAHTFSMLEIDPRLTKDGAIVVHHDATLDRTTTGTGLLSDRTLAELKALRLKDDDGNVTNHRIPTLDEVMIWARGKTILVLDQKDVPVQMRIEKVREHRAEAYAMLIVGRLEDIVACHAENPDQMMEVMIPDHQRIAAFNASGVPWENVIAFVGHLPPEDKTLYEAIHAHRASCMVGTSRNLDRQFHDRDAVDRDALRADYQELLQRGADIIETDLPREVGPLLFADKKKPAGALRLFFEQPSP